jgi:hypothetical protein
MSRRRALCLSLALFAACDDDDVAAPPQPDAGPTVVDASPGTLDATLHGEDASEAGSSPPGDTHDAGTRDAGPAPDASAPNDTGANDAGSLDCSTLGLTYDNYGAQFIYLWCLACHAKMEPFFTTPELIRTWAPAIRSETVDSKRMPPGGNANYLRDPQREELGRWLDCGAP